MSVQIQAFSFNAFQENTVVVSDVEGNAVIVDPGCYSNEEAKILGYQNFAEVSLVPKMATSPDQVISFLEDLAARARTFAENDLAELREFARPLGVALSMRDMGGAEDSTIEKKRVFLSRYGWKYGS